MANWRQFMSCGQVLNVHDGIAFQQRRRLSEVLGTWDSRRFAVAAIFRAWGSEGLLHMAQPSGVVVFF